MSINVYLKVELASLQRKRFITNALILNSKVESFFFRKACAPAVSVGKIEEYSIHLVLPWISEAQ